MNKIKVLVVASGDRLEKLKIKCLAAGEFIRVESTKYSELDITGIKEYDLVIVDLAKEAISYLVAGLLVNEAKKLITTTNLKLTNHQLDAIKNLLINSKSIQLNTNDIPAYIQKIFVEDLVYKNLGGMSNALERK